MNPKCALCGEEIQDADRVLPIRCDFAKAGETGTMVHLECMVRAVIGSVGHMQRLCSCYGKVDHSEDGLTQHEAAIAAFRYFELNGGGL